jgi:hypothetical protein
MRLLKLFEEYVQSKEVINTNVYTLSEHTDTSGEPIYGIWIDLDEVEKEARLHDTQYPSHDSAIMLMTCELEIPKIDILKHMGIEDEPDYQIENYEILDFIKDVNWDDYVIDEDYKTLLELPAPPPINKTTDELIDEVIRKLNTIYNRTERNGFRKYTHLYLDKDGNMTFDEEDENGNENENISIRIANHTFNPLRGINDLNVLICNKDETRNKFRFAENDLEYDETDNPDLIVKDIISYF